MYHSWLNRIFLGLTLCIACGATFADISHNEALKLRSKGVIMPLSTLLDAVDTRYPLAQILEVELDRDDGRYVYEIELITRDGVVRELTLDAASAAILHDEIDD